MSVRGGKFRMRRVPEPLRPLAKSALAAGWHISFSRGDHMLWRSPTGSVVVSAGTPSAVNTVHTMRRELRKAGLVV